MKKTLLLLFALFIYVFALSQKPCNDNAFVLHHENGSVKMEGSLNCYGQMHGSFVEYYEDGVIMGYGEYEHGQKSGKWVIFDKFNPGIVWILMYDENGQRTYTSKNHDNVTLEERVFEP